MNPQHIFTSFFFSLFFKDKNVLSCSLGRNFTNTTSISSSGEDERTATSPSCTVRTTRHVAEFAAPAQTGHFLPSDVCLHTPLCLWTGLVIHWMPRFLLIALWSGSMRTSKNFYVESLPTKEESRTLRAPWWCPVCSSQPTEGFKQTWASWHHGGQACMGGTPRTWVFGGTAVHTNGCMI